MSDLDQVLQDASREWDIPVSVLRRTYIRVVQEAVRREVLLDQAIRENPECNCPPDVERTPMTEAAKRQARHPVDEDKATE